MARVDRTVRLSQTIVPFGVGAVYDIFGESFVGCDTIRWGQHGRPVQSRALCALLGVSALRAAPSTTSNGAGIPYLRFPLWLFCQRCRRLIKWRTSWERPDEPAICLSCQGFNRLVPMRFVVACANGHLADVPWDIWAHSQHKAGSSKCPEPKLEFRSRKAGNSGLASLEVRCMTCKSARSLSGITAKDSLEKLGLHCLGIQPWQSFAARDACDQVPTVIQRGASNLYFANVASALDIPTSPELGTFSEKRSLIEGNAVFATLKRIERSGPVYEQLLAMIQKDTKASKEEIELILQEAPKTGAIAGAAPDLSSSEWFALITPQSGDDIPDNFRTRHASLLPVDTEPETLEAIFIHAIDRVVQVTRLKEVRALRSFSRIQPGGHELRPDLTRDEYGSPRRIDWLPAVEIFGEGVFLSFNEDAISKWEKQKAVVTRVETLQHRIAESTLGASILRQRLGTDAVTARFVFLHTFAHLLIRELCFECGYSSAALRERIFSRSAAEGSPQAGVLVYTAAGDSEGTLGGLVRQAEAPRLISSLLRALESGVWCSADPICRESGGQGYDKTNLAACHACCLLPETSCVCGNLLLDRTFVVEPGKREIAFLVDPASI